MRERDTLVSLKKKEEKASFQITGAQFGSPILSIQTHGLGKGGGGGTEITPNYFWASQIQSILGI